MASEPTGAKDMYYETVALGGGAGTGSVAERTTHSLELRDDHLSQPDLLDKHRPWVVRGGSWKTGPWRVVSATTPYLSFTVPGGWPEIQEAFAIKLAALLNGEEERESQIGSGAKGSPPA